MKKFLCYRNKNAADTFVAALLSAGYAETKFPREADFLLYDHERRDGTAGIFKNKPIFIYGHTPYSWWIWDGICEVHPASCNFVSAIGAKNGMESYGYPYRVEPIGFPRCEVKPFAPTTGKRLLFAPAHPLNVDSKFPQPDDYDYHFKAMEFIEANKNSFDGVKVRHLHSLKDNGFDKFAGTKGIEFEQITTLGDAAALDAISQADLVIACNTFAFLSYASGKPTIGYGSRKPSSRRGYVLNYEKYKPYADFPNLLENMTIQQVLDTRLAPNPSGEDWKRLMIGASFDAEKFLSIVKEYVQ